MQNCENSGHEFDAEVKCSIFCDFPNENHELRDTKHSRIVYQNKYFFVLRKSAPAVMYRNVLAETISSCTLRKEKGKNTLIGL